MLGKRKKKSAAASGSGVAGQAKQKGGGRGRSLLYGYLYNMTCVLSPVLSCCSTALRATALSAAISGRSGRTRTAAR